MHPRPGMRFIAGILSILTMGVVAWGQLPFEPLLKSDPVETAITPTAPAAPLAKPAEAAKPLEPLVPLGVENHLAHEGCIVLRDGTVQQGQILELAGGYQVSTRSGASIVSFDQVRVVADSMSAAYEQIRASYERPTASDHLELARWCSQNGLIEESLAEAEHALVLEPHRKEAAELVRKAEQVLNVSHQDTTDRSEPTRQAGGGAISAQSQADFIRHIQPLMVNKCGNGTCHGTGSSSDLKLFAVRTGARPQRIQSQQNLTTILKYIDIANPDQSPLLTTSRNPDGPHAAVFQGDRGSQQYNRLLAWVEHVAQDQRTGVPAPRREVGNWREGPRISVKPRQELSTDQKVVQASSEVEVPRPNPRHPPATPQRGPLQSKSVQRLLSNHAPDAFDPDVFNRMVHGEGSRDQTDQPEETLPDPQPIQIP